MMTNQRFRLFAIALGISSFLGVGAAQAQQATMTAAPHVSAMRARPVSTSVAAAPRTSSRIPAAPHTRTHSRVSPNDLFSGGGSFGLFNPIGAPDFGFGLGTSSLMNQDWAIKAAIDPATQWRLFEAQKFLRNNGFVGSGFYLLDSGGYYEVPSDSGEANQPEQQPQQQQPIVIVQAPQAAQPAAESAPSEPEETSAPLPDVGQFVLVLRNGTQIQAVAFSRSGDRIVYITADGLRRTLALADLDNDSTARINEERGTPLQLPL